MRVHPCATQNSRDGNTAEYQPPGHQESQATVQTDGTCLGLEDYGKALCNQGSYQLDTRYMKVGAAIQHLGVRSDYRRRRALLSRIAYYRHLIDDLRDYASFASPKIATILPDAARTEILVDLAKWSTHPCNCMLTLSTVGQQLHARSR